MPELSFRHYVPSDAAACAALFEANCPRFFAESERKSYADYLSARPAGYQVCVLDQKVVGAFGIHAISNGKAEVKWVIVDPAAHGSGIGSAMMKRAAELARELKCTSIEIRATHKSAPFFARFGARSVTSRRKAIDDGVLEVEMEMLL